MNARTVEHAVAVLFVATLTTCDWMAVGEICDPAEGRARVGFYSTGDCAGLNAAAFLGHEWLTFIGNQASEDPLDRDDLIFTEVQIADIIEGNRRIDFPVELLVHLDNGPLAYIDALTEYHNVPSRTTEHFILDDQNYTDEAWQASLGMMRERTLEAVAKWSDDQVGALTKIGQVCHTLQDSFSLAHSDRMVDSKPDGTDNEPWCIRQLSVYFPRLDGSQCQNCADPDGADYCLEIKLHNRLQENQPGHTTAQDSIYEARQDCLDVGTQDEVWECLKPVSRQAIVATRDYLTIVRELVTTNADEAVVDARMAPFFETHFSLCAPRTFDRCPEPPPDPNRPGERCAPCTDPGTN